MSLGRLLTWLLALVVGVGLRIGYAEVEPDVRGWEADRFATALEPAPDPARLLRDGPASWNRLRPPGAGWVYGAATEALEARSVLDVRRVAIGASLASALIAGAAALLIARLSCVDRFDAGWALSSAAWAWALMPTLIASGISPDGEALLGAALCLLAGGAALWRAGPAPLGWFTMLVGGVVASAVGGVGAVAGASVAAVLYVIALPPPGRALAALGLPAAMAASCLFVQSDADAERPWLPDTAGVHSVAALLDVEPDLDVLTLRDADARELALLDATRSRARELGPVALARRVVSRGLFDVLSPHRFVGGPLPAVGVGLLDLILRGGMLLFAFAVLGGLRRHEGVGRLALGAGFVTFLVWRVVTATGPYDLAPLDLVLCALAAAGMAGADPERAGIRRFAFGVGAALLIAPGVGAWLGERPVDRWLTTLGHDSTRVEALVDALTTAERSAADELRLSSLYQQVDTPFLRRPERALDHAIEALYLDPMNPVAFEALVFAHVENLQFDEARELARERLVVDGLEKDARVMLEKIEYEARRVAENERTR